MANWGNGYSGALRVLFTAQYRNKAVFAFFICLITFWGLVAYKQIQPKIEEIEAEKAYEDAGLKDYYPTVKTYWHVNVIVFYCLLGISLWFFSAIYSLRTNAHLLYLFDIYFVSYPIGAMIVLFVWDVDHYLSKYNHTRPRQTWTRMKWFFTRWD